MLHLKKIQRTRPNKSKYTNLKIKKQKNSMQCKIKKPFFGEPNRSKLKKFKKQKFSMNCKRKKLL